MGLRFHILYLYELSDLEDLGLDSENGVVPILSDALVSHDIKPYSTRAHEDNEPWMDITRLALTLPLQYMTSH